MAREALPLPVLPDGGRIQQGAPQPFRIPPSEMEFQHPFRVEAAVVIDRRIDPLQEHGYHLRMSRSGQAAAAAVRADQADRQECGRTNAAALREITGAHWNLHLLPPAPVARRHWRIARRRPENIRAQITARDCPVTCLFKAQRHFCAGPLVAPRNLVQRQHTARCPPGDFRQHVARCSRGATP